MTWAWGPPSIRYSPAGFIDPKINIRRLPADFMPQFKYITFFSSQNELSSPHSLVFASQFFWQFYPNPKKCKFEPFLDLFPPCTRSSLKCLEKLRALCYNLCRNWAELSPLSELLWWRKIFKSWVAFLQGFLSINPSGRVKGIFWQNYTTSFCGMNVGYR